MHFHITYLKQLNFVFKSAAPIVGDRKIGPVVDMDIYIKIVRASIELRKEFGNKVPFSVIFPGAVDGKDYIIAAVNLKNGTPIYNVPAEFEGFPLLIDYGTFLVSSYDAYREYQTLKPGISIRDSEINDVYTLGAFFKTKSQPNKNHLLTVKHGVGHGDSSVIQLGKGNPKSCCARVKYQDLYVDESGRLIDYAFCEKDHYCESISNRPCIILNNIQSTLDSKIEEIKIVNVQKVGRMTGHTAGRLVTTLQPVTITNLFDDAIIANVLLVTSEDINVNFGDRGDSGSPVYDQDGGLWGIYEGTYLNGAIFAVIPIDIILESVYKKENMEFELLDNNRTS